MLWAGERINRLERWPKRYYSGLFVVTWLSLSLLGRYVGLSGGSLDRRYFSWVGAVAIGLLCTGVVWLGLYLTHFRRAR
jgi:hypothetical protein